MPFIRRANSTLDDFAQGRDMSGLVRREDDSPGLIIGFVEDADVDPQDEVIAQGDYDTSVTTLESFNSVLPKRDPKDYERRTLRQKYRMWKQERNALRLLVDDGDMTAGEVQTEIEELQVRKTSLDEERALIGV